MYYGVYLNYAKEVSIVDGVLVPYCCEFSFHLIQGSIYIAGEQNELYVNCVTYK